MLVSACSALVGETPVDRSPADGVSDGSSPSNADCIRFTGDHSSHVDTGSLAGDALFLSGEIFLCASDVVIVGLADVNEISAASQLAAALSGPLLFPEPRLAAELGRLKPERVHLVGSPEVNIPGEAQVVDHDMSSAVELARETLEAGPPTTTPAIPDSSTIVDTVLAIEAGDRVVVSQAPPAASVSSTSSSVAAPAGFQTEEIVVGLAEPTPASALWLVDASNPATVLLAAAVGTAIDASVLALDGSDILGNPDMGAALEGHGDDTVRYVGPVPEASEWSLAVLANGQQVPGGGFYVLPADQPRRYVAYYGHPGAASLGVLGEQGPAETRALMQGFVEAYAGDGAQVIPTFEIIASVASAGPGDDGDYSTEWPPGSFAEWITYAGDNDMYVVLDLQSGREDFLGQAKLYEELLKLPYVGLALDPEWRLTDDQVHLNQTGTVDASEINETVNWVADLVRDNGLPQKMMIVHQFKVSMITNREDIVQRPEIQMIVQMDGDGHEAEKNDTWAAVKKGSEDAHWAWGWKNFFDEDEPGPPTPESTMGKVPTPVYVSYQ